MGLKDYYSILHIEINASEEEIRSAFRSQAIRWHPDRNEGLDTTSKMQEINEAYLILKDKEARERYNIQYRIFKQQTDFVVSSVDVHKVKNETKFENTDEILKKWMNNAQQQSVGLTQQLIIELRASGKRALIGAGEGFVSGLKWQLIVGSIFFLLFLIIKSCQ